MTRRKLATVLPERDLFFRRTYSVHFTADAWRDRSNERTCEQRLVYACKILIPGARVCVCGPTTNHEASRFLPSGGRSESEGFRGGVGVCKTLRYRLSNQIVVFAA